MEKIPVKIEMPSALMSSLGESPESLQKNLITWAAVGLYSLNKLSLAKAASLAELHIYDFETLLSQNNISISKLNKDDLDRETELLDKL